MTQLQQLIVDICEDSAKLQSKVDVIARRRAFLTIDKIKVAQAAEDGLRFWRRTHLEELMKAFDLGDEIRS